MISPLSYASRTLYRYIARPLLFMMKPDTVHTGMVRFCKVVQRPVFVRAMIRGTLAYRHEAMLSQQLHGITFANPIGVSAGFDKNIELLPMIASIGCGLMEGGTVTNLPCAGNRRPWYYRLPKTKSLVVRAGLPNHGADAIMARVTAMPATMRGTMPLNVSVAPSNVSAICSVDDMVTDCTACAAKVRDAKAAAMITLNLSCPNTSGGEPFTEPDNLEKLLTSIDTLQLSMPVFLKMPNQLPWKQFNALLAVAVQHNVTGVTIANLIKDRSTVEINDEGHETKRGGISGRPTFAPSNSLIKKTYQNYGDRLTIIGVGGVFSAEDAYTKIKCGASLVELITGLIYEGPGLVGHINRELVQLLQRDGYSHISQAVGVNAND